MIIRNRIDEGSLSVLQLTVILICFAINMLDGMDVLAIAFAAPAISNDWSLEPQQLGFVFSAALIGMTIGAVTLSPYTDVIGRRKMIMICLALISVGMVATSWADSLLSLILLRLVAGLGIGAILASLTSMVSEFAPDRHRDLSVSFLQAGYPIGAMLTGFIAAWLIPEHGWRSLFLCAGVISLAVIPVVGLWLPESVEFLEKRRGANALDQINHTLSRMHLQPVTSDELHASATLGNQAGLASLFIESFRSATLMICSAFAMSFMTLYFLLSWVVKLAVEAGLGFENAVYAGVCLNLGAFTGAIALGQLAKCFGLKRVIALFFTIGAGLIVAYGHMRSSVSLVLALIFLVMFFYQGAFIGLYAVAARIYPTTIRTRGVGFAIGAGRVGAIIGPSLAGVVLSQGLSIAWTFTLFAVPAIGAAIVVAKMDAKHFLS